MRRAGGWPATSISTSPQLATDGVETLALSSTARSPVRVTIEVPRDEVDELAALLAEAQHVIETLRQGLGIVPDSLPEEAL